MSPPYRGCFVYRGAFFACELRDPNGVVAAQPFAPEERYGCGVPLAGIAGAISCRNYRLRINLFVCTVCRLRGRHAQWSCPTNMERTLAVGRDDSARRCRNYRLRTNLPSMSLRDPNGVVAAQPFAPEERYGCGVPPAQPFARNERYGCGVPPAQPFATKERYGCGVPLAGIAGIAGAISCRNCRLRINHSPATTGIQKKMTRCPSPCHLFLHINDC